MATEEEIRPRSLLIFQPMNTASDSRGNRPRRNLIGPGGRWQIAIALCCAAALGTSSARAGDNKTTPTAATTEEEETPKNWIELGIGGGNIGGEDAQFKK